MADHPPSGGLSGQACSTRDLQSHALLHSLPDWRRWGFPNCYLVGCHGARRDYHDDDDSQYKSLLLSILFFLALQCLCEGEEVWKMHWTIPVLNFARFQKQFLKYCSSGPSWHLLCSSFHRIQPAKTARTHYPDCVHDRWFLKGLLATRQNGKFCKMVLWLASLLAKGPVYAQG